MTTDGSGTSDDVDESDFISPSLSIQERHDRLLDDLHAARYGSRSEAVRAAIQSHANSVLGSGETGIEQISRQLMEVKVQMEELADQVDEMQKQLDAGNTVESSSQSRNDAGSSRDQLTVDSTETEGSADLQNMIYATLSEHDQMSVPEIAERIGEDPFCVHESVEQLIEEYGFVTSTETSGAPQYRIKQLDLDQ